jgi:NAD(P)H dehydrogenase (quinone)
LKIAVTAASGRLGRRILSHLVAEGSHDIIAIVRKPDSLKLPGVEVRAGDYDSAQQMTDAFAGIDTVLMISAPVVIGIDRVTQHRNVIAAAKAAGVRKVVFTSVIGNGLEMQTMFADAQQVNRQAEQDLAESGLEFINARAGLYLDLDLLHIQRADREGGVYSNNAGVGRCGYISIDELAYGFAGLCLSDTCNGRILNMVGETYTQAELVEMANEVFGLNTRYEPMTAEENIARFMQDEKISARGEAVARMLTGCFECIEVGAYDVESDYKAATGREPLTLHEQMQAIRDNVA